MSESPMSDRQFSKTFFTVIALLVLLTVFLVVLAFINSSEVSDKLAAAKQAEIDKVVAARVEPVGTLNVGEVPEATATTSAPAAATGGESAAEEPLSGEQVYQQACAACHATGVAGAPKTGDAAAWADRIGQGEETLYDHAINGFQGQAGMMPAKGGNPNLSDDEVRAAVDYLVGESQ